jgi:uncharacterized protein YndB with AHSA1/START domain
MPDLKFALPVNAPPNAVYAAVATQAGMRSWWTADTQMQEMVGGKAEFGFEKRAVVYRMTVDKLEVGRRVVLSCSGDEPEWKGTTLTFDIAPGDDGKGAKLRFVHGGWREYTDFCASCNAMWGNLMFRLKDSVEGKSRGPQWLE